MRASRFRCLAAGVFGLGGLLRAFGRYVLSIATNQPLSSTEASESGKRYHVVSNYLRKVRDAWTNGLSG